MHAAVSIRCAISQLRSGTYYCAALPKIYQHLPSFLIESISADGPTLVRVWVSDDRYMITAFQQNGNVWSNFAPYGSQAHGR